MDIPVETSSRNSNTWGQFYIPPSWDTLDVGDCEVTILAAIYLREDLDLQGDRDTTYTYTPHTPMGGGGFAGSSTGRPQVRGGILAHERGHASAFLANEAHENWYRNNGFTIQIRRWLLLFLAWEHLNFCR